jgi:hypothetical protein
VGLRKQIQQLSRSRLASVLARLDFATCHHAVLDDGANQIAAAAAFYKSNLYLVIPLLNRLRSSAASDVNGSNPG